MTTPLISNATVSTPEQIKTTVSTVSSNSPKSLENLTSTAKEASSDSVLLQTEIQDSLNKLLESLVSNGALSEKDALKRFIESNEPAGVFVQSLQESIFEAKSSTSQGLFLKTQLDKGAITQEQFKSEIEGIVFTVEQAQSAVAGDIAAQVQRLLLTLTSDKDLKVLPLLTSESLINNTVAAEEELTSESLINNTVAAEEELKSGSLINNTVAAEEELKSGSETKSPTSQGKLSSGKDNDSFDFFQKMIQVAAGIAARNAQASLSSLISLRVQPSIISGARAVVKINGQVTALCVNVSYEISTNWTEIRGVDELIPNDLAPDSFSVKGSMTLYRVPNGSPIKSYLSQDMFGGILWPYSTIEIRDKRTDELIMLVKRAAITSRAESFSPNQLTTTTMSFIGIGFRDEELPQVLPDTLPSGSANSSIWDKFASGIKKLNPF